MSFKWELGLATLCHEKGRLLSGMDDVEQRSYARESGLFPVLIDSFFLLLVRNPG
jgi:hypothetical protein